MSKQPLFSISVSACSNPDFTLEQALFEYGKIGYSRFELFTSWVKSAVNINEIPELYLKTAEKCGFKFSSIHIPPITDDMDTSIKNAVKGCKIGDKLGCRVAIIKASSRENYIHGGKKLLELIDGLDIIPVITNHNNTAITTLDDYREVINGINDSRMKYLLEVGHFHSAGVNWRDGYDLLKGGIELVHIKDQIKTCSVQFGTGEIDLKGFFKQLIRDEYKGDIVVEMEVQDKENTLIYLNDALKFIQRECVK